MQLGLKAESAAQALRVELHAMEASAASFTASLEQNPSLEQLAATKQHLEGRFRFLWGIYRAHSEVPAVELNRF